MHDKTEGKKTKDRTSHSEDRYRPLSREESREYWRREGCLTWSRYIIAPVLIALVAGVSAVLVALIAKNILGENDSPTPTASTSIVSTIEPTGTLPPNKPGEFNGTNVTPSPTITSSLTVIEKLPSSPPPPCIREQPSGWLSFSVQWGDTLFSLAKRTRTTVAKIQQVNCLPNYDIYAGQKLWVPAESTLSASGCSAYHTVTRGQTLSSIGRIYKVSPMAIDSANDICNPNRLYVGQTLCIPGW